nr:stromal interaction molecule 1 [Hymenolepis microstoma]
MRIFFNCIIFLICTTEVCANAGDVSQCRKKTLAFEAIADLHNQLDGDDSGGVDFSEAQNFLGEKLSYPLDQFNQRDLSQEDGIISLLDLWVAWRKNPAHNWTVSETVKWLTDIVELPEYSQIFSDNMVDGESIPRFVSRNAKFLSDELGIKNSLHRRKLSLKAMDLILFGPPKKNSSTVAAAGSLLVHLTRDMPFVSTLVVASAFIFSLAVLNHHYTLRLRYVTSGNLDRLSKAEQTLHELHQELVGLKEVESTTSTSSSNNRPASNRTVQIDDVLFQNSDSGRSSEQIPLIAGKHSRTEPPTRKPSESSFFPRRTVADANISSAPWSTSPVLPGQNSFYTTGSERLSGISVTKPPMDSPVTELALLLQMTHELELRHYWEKRSAAAKQLMIAKEACDRMRRKRSSLVGSVRLIHSDNLDDVDTKLNAARRVLENVTADMQERKHRWSRIEELTGLNLQQPADISALMTALGYDKSRCRLGEDSNSTLRLFDLSTDFSLFTGDDFAEEQPNSMCLRSNEEAYNRTPLNWQSKSMIQNLSNRLHSEVTSAPDTPLPHPDARNEASPPSLLVQPNIHRNYSFVRPFANLWRRKVKSHHQQLGCFSPSPQTLPQIRPHFTIDPIPSVMSYDGYHRKPSTS